MQSDIVNFQRQGWRAEEILAGLAAVSLFPLLWMLSVSLFSVAASAASAPRAAARVSQAAFNEDADGARVVLSANAPLLYTAYEPRPDLLVVDLPLGEPVRQAVSVGDILAYSGAAWFIVRGMHRRGGVGSAGDPQIVESSP